MNEFSRAFAKMAPEIREDELETITQHPITGIKREIPGERSVSVCIHQAKRNPAPVLFELHGGGFVFGSEMKNDAFAHSICERMDINVISIGYCKAPENPYPSPIEDVYRVIKWFYDNSKSEGLNKKAFAVMGFSAGANLATVVSMLAKKRGDFALCAQVLHYPYLDLVTPAKEKTIYESDIPIEVMEAFGELYCSEEERALSTVSPVMAEKEELMGVAPSMIITAQEDALKEEAVRYAQLLEDAGIEVRYECQLNAHHGYIEDWYNPALYESVPKDRKETHHALFGDAAQNAVELSVDFLKTRME